MSLCLITQGDFFFFRTLWQFCLFLEYPSLSGCSDGKGLYLLYFGYVKQCLPGLQILLNNLLQCRATNNFIIALKAALGQVRAWFVRR